jgi:site-specific recombinase
VVRIMEARLHDRKLGDILAANLHLLSRKIIERAGHTGEHYITTSRGQYGKMLLSAGGGGLLTTLTAVLKFSITWLKLPLFVEALLLGSNYAGSFLLMQFLGFTLATKQPSVTAAALAVTLQKTAGHAELGPLVTTIACITRSQLAAAIGNIGLVIPGVLGFDFVWRNLHAGAPFLDAETATYVVHSLDPLHTGTVFFAALTGVLLWSSSIAAGWLENFGAYRRLPEAVADHWLGRFVGRGTMAYFSRVFARNIAGLGGNVALGVLLAATPIAGKFFGLPLDVRHVTLSAGALALAASSLGTQGGHGAWLMAVLGIVVIGALNFGVSFVLALSVALRARQVERGDRWRLLASVAATLVRSPAQFFWPPRSSAHTEVHGPVSILPPAGPGSSSDSPR